MEVTKFINSKAIKDYLEKVQYTFSSLEAAWLIYQCKNATMKEKHMAWEELIETMLDCKIPERLNTRAQESLHEFLEEYMRIQNKYIALGKFETEKEREIYQDVFEGLWFEFPVPFEKGDIVWLPRHARGNFGGPFVNKGICLEGVKSERVKEHVRREGDTTDMCVRGYFLNEDGSIYAECVDNYMDLEYYPKELTGTERTLITISNIFKEEKEGFA